MLSDKTDCMEAFLLPQHRKQCSTKKSGGSPENGLGKAKGLCELLINVADNVYLQILSALTNLKKKLIK